MFSSNSFSPSSLNVPTVQVTSTPTVNQTSSNHKSTNLFGIQYLSGFTIGEFAAIIAGSVFICCVLIVFLYAMCRSSKFKTGDEMLNWMRNSQGNITLLKEKHDKSTPYDKYKDGTPIYNNPMNHSNAR
jgi:hypothetical protein